MTTVRQAILLAADHIERNPQDFNFSLGDVPHECGTPGCALGWVGHFLGVRNDNICDRMSRTVVAMGFEKDIEFYCRADEMLYGRYKGSGGWRSTATECAAMLRKYADKYHAESTQPTKPKVLPDSIRQLFYTRAVDPDMCRRDREQPVRALLAGSGT